MLAQCKHIHLSYQLHLNGITQNIDTLINALNELGEKCGYTTKSYNLLAIILMIKGQIDKALKIFDSALNDLKLDTAEGEAGHLYNGNNDLSALLVNYIKCNVISNGVGNGSEFLKNDELNKRLLGYLGKVNKELFTEFFEERKVAESKFD
jgi:tetratricopeptide (TPR) repeat protein